MKIGVRDRESLVSTLNHIKNIKKFLEKLENLSTMDILEEVLAECEVSLNQKN